MKRVALSLLAFSPLALVACGAPLGDPSHEIIETSKGVVAKMVTLKTTPSIKSRSLADAGRDWQSFGWAKVNSASCKAIALLENQSIETFEIQITGYAPDNIPTYNLRLCASQLTNPKRIVAIGYVVSRTKAELPKP